MACDICGKHQTNLIPLLDIYQTADIKDICDECETVVNQQLLKIKDMTIRMNSNFLQRFMENLKEKFKKN